MGYPVCLCLLAFISTATAVAVTADSIPTLTAATNASSSSISPPTTPTPDATADSVPDLQEDDGECKLLGPFSLLVQAALGAIAALSLVYKRWRERPQRPLKVWAFDVSKQVFGSGMLHLANVFMSMFSAGQFEIAKKYKPNPCSYYLLNLGIDTTLGIPILVLILRILNYFASFTPLAKPPESIESGNYDHPPRASWWFKQSVIYVLGLLNMKICVLFVIQMLPFIVQVGDWALRWTEGNTAVQIFFVMLFFPVIMNAIQYYIIDTLIKKPIPVHHEIPREDEDEFADAMMNDDRHNRSALLAAMDDSDSSESDDGLPGKVYENHSDGSSLSEVGVSGGRDRVAGTGTGTGTDTGIGKEHARVVSSASASSSSNAEYHRRPSSVELKVQQRRD